MPLRTELVVQDPPDVSSVSTDPYHTVVFKHPGYQDDNNRLLTLPAYDDSNGGFDIDTVKTICGIIAGSRWDGLFTEDQDGPPVQVLEASAEYYFVLSDPSGGQDTTYPIVPAFMSGSSPTTIYLLHGQEWSPRKLLTEPKDIAQTYDARWRNTRSEPSRMLVLHKPSGNALPTPCFRDQSGSSEQQEQIANALLDLENPPAPSQPSTFLQSGNDEEANTSDRANSAYTPAEDPLDHDEEGRYFNIRTAALAAERERSDRDGVYKKEPEWAQKELMRKDCDSASIQKLYEICGYEIIE